MSKPSPSGFFLGSLMSVQRRTTRLLEAQAVAPMEMDRHVGFFGLCHSRGHSRSLELLSEPSRRGNDLSPTDSVQGRGESFPFQAKVLVLLLLFDLWRRDRIRCTLFASSECYLDGNRELRFGVWVAPRLPFDATQFFLPTQKKTEECKTPATMPHLRFSRIKGSR